MKKIKNLFIVFISIILLISLESCGTNESDKKIITVTTSAWGSIVKSISGDKLEVNIVVDSSKKNPHDYELNAVEISKIKKSKLIIKNGGNYDRFINPALKDDIAVISAKDNISPEVLKSNLKDINEHYFYSLLTAQKFAQKIFTEISKLDESNKDFYKQNWEKFNKLILENIGFSQKIKKDFLNIKYMQNELLANYLLTELGFTDVTPENFINSITKEIPLSSKQVTNFLDKIKNENLNLVIVNTNENDSLKEKIIEESKLNNVKVVNLSETPNSIDQDYNSWQKENLQIIKNSLMLR